jgi:uncharacterized damage-inducible protein DinB
MRESDTITTLFRHHLWANVSLFEVCAVLSDEQLEAKIAGTYGSIRDMMQHIAYAERNYLHRIQTGQRFPRDENAPKPNVVELCEAIRKSGEEFIEAAPKVKPQDAVTIQWRDGKTRSVPCSILVTQAINHATEHRAQIMTTLTHLGVEPPDIDGWAYFDSLNK